MAAKPDPSGLGYPCKSKSGDTTERWASVPMAQPPIRCRPMPTVPWMISLTPVCRYTVHNSAVLDQQQVVEAFAQFAGLGMLKENRVADGKRWGVGGQPQWRLHFAGALDTDISEPWRHDRPGLFVGADPAGCDVTPTLAGDHAGRRHPDYLKGEKGRRLKVNVMEMLEKSGGEKSRSGCDLRQGHPDRVLPLFCWVSAT
jgi:hypothetical protein